MVQSTSPNQWTCFCMIRTSVMKELMKVRLKAPVDDKYRLNYHSYHDNNTIDCSRDCSVKGVIF